ncbi:lactate utilization protein [Mesotoga sp. H07.pep.5.3]|uniref:lactate utilization protein n=1 Tax=Mesotoga sp. H07.pep.5.3 TaxID=1421003 RepID=UPI000C1817E5|nr:lactate utilization protein [Mesotoga sp. H07.pep.5.3]PIJ60858.1 membrane protein [Mesotoga sp. H07.pep.5.3]
MRNSLWCWKNEKLSERLAKVFEGKAIKFMYFQDREMVVDAVSKLVPDGATVSAGGSLTLIETGVSDLLKSGKYNFLDRDSVSGNEEKKRIMLSAFEADYYFCSANAITESGEILLLDGNGNRAAAVTFGPDKVILIAGVNKVVSDLDAGIKRIRSIAPMNAKRLNLHTPCAESGLCTDCDSDERICEIYSIIVDSRRRPWRYTIILVGEELGL